MKTKLKWKGGIFSNTFEIFSDGVAVGNLKENTWKQSADGELFGERYLFKTKGFFKQETQIIDANNGSFLGTIKFNSWRTRATIEYLERVVNWKYDNLWNTKWSISDFNGVQVLYEGSSSKGKIELNKQNELLLLAGLYITNYYWQISIAVIVAILVPVYSAILN
jgi:hypothetical protein